MVPQTTIDEIQSRCDIVEVIGEAVPLKRAGRNFKGLCPFHNEKTPSFTVNPDKQIFHCFGCGEGGNLFTFMMKYEKLTFPEVLSSLAERVGIRLPSFSRDEKGTSVAGEIYRVNKKAMEYYHKTLTDGNSALRAKDYFKARGLDNVQIDAFRLGHALDGWKGLMDYCKKDGIDSALLEKAGLVLTKNGNSYDRFRARIVFPIFDLRDRVVGFGARILEDDAQQAKYINSPETPVYTKGRHLYGLNLASKEVVSKDYILIVEGYMDCIALFRYGFKNAAASLGTALTKEQIRLIKRRTSNVIMVYDADEAGIKAALRALDTLVSEEMNVKIVTLPKGADPDSFLKAEGAEKFNGQIERAVPLFDFKLEFLLKGEVSSDIEAKSRICRELLGTVSNVPNAVLRAEYVKFLAQRLDIDQEALLVELRKLKKRPLSLRRQQEVSSRIHQRECVRSSERMLIGLMFEDESSIRIVHQQLSLEEFASSLVRGIVERIFSAHFAHQPLEPTRIMDSLEDEHARRIMSESLISMDSLVNKEKTLTDCIERIKQDNIQIRLNELQKEIESAQREGNEDRITRLVTEHTVLVRGKKR